MKFRLRPPLGPMITIGRHKPSITKGLGTEIDEEDED